MELTQYLPEDIDREAEILRKRALEVGLDPFTTIFELVDYKQLNEIAAYGGFPTRYPHWRWGMEYDRISKSYTYGLSIIYEMVINNDPCYAYLLRANSLASQKTVIAHVFGHSDFFKNNYWFSKTNRKMLDKISNHAATIRAIMADVGQSEVENFIDVCLSVEGLIDVHRAFRNTKPHVSDEEKEKAFLNQPIKLHSKPYMDSYVNPKDYIDQQKEIIFKKAKQLSHFPSEPETDVLQFLLEYAPLISWQKIVLSIIRDEAYYFAPQGQTKILNEGWATYWHSKMMTSISPLSAAEIVDYCDQYAGIVASQGGSLNPYRLGVELLRYVEWRWDTGRFGKNYLECADRDFKKRWDHSHAHEPLGRKKLFEIRALHNDVTFIDDFFDEEFCEQTKMFVYDKNKKNGQVEISSKEFKKIKSSILRSITNMGRPLIQVIDGNYKNRGELVLRHLHDEIDLQQSVALDVLKNLFKIWNRPVHLETIVEKEKMRLSFDGNTNRSEKI
jgi:stage V sporulation protein R